MELHGKVVAIQPTRQGQSARTGEVWMSQGFVLEMDGQYVHRAKLSLWGLERIQAARLQLGEYVTAKFEIEAHEHQGEWYNDLRVYDIVANGASRLRRPRQQAPMQQQVPMQQHPPYQQQQQQTQYVSQQQLAQQQQQQSNPW